MYPILFKTQTHIFKISYIKNYRIRFYNRSVIISQQFFISRAMYSGFTNETNCFFPRLQNKCHFKKILKNTKSLMGKSEALPRRQTTYFFLWLLSNLFAEQKTTQSLLVRSQSTACCVKASCPKFLKPLTFLPVYKHGQGTWSWLLPWPHVLLVTH